MRFLFLPICIIILFLSSCGTKQNTRTQADASAVSTNAETLSELEEKWAVAIFAGGCFWCTEAAFEQIKGVKEVIAGYAGGKEKNPTYKQVSYGQTSHTEAIKIFYDPSIISYQQLLDIFFVAHDPTQLNRQGPDVGAQYRSAIFYNNQDEKKWIDQSISTLNDSGKFSKKIVTEVVPYTEFWIAEDYHQDYYRLNPNDSYMRSVGKPKIDKVRKTFPQWLK